MRIETHNNLNNLQVTECTRAIVRDVNDKPVLLILEPGPGHIYIVAPDEPGFNQALQVMGIEGTVIADTLDMRKLTPPPGELLLPPGS
jgi:hypothetical protein